MLAVVNRKRSHAPTTILHNADYGSDRGQVVEMRWLFQRVAFGRLGSILERKVLDLQFHSRSQVESHLCEDQSKDKDHVLEGRALLIPVERELRRPSQLGGRKIKRMTCVVTRPRFSRHL